MFKHFRGFIKTFSTASNIKTVSNFTMEDLISREIHFYFSQCILALSAAYFSLNSFMCALGILILTASVINGGARRR